MSLPNPTFIGQQETVNGKTYQAASVNPPVWKGVTTGTHGRRIEELERGTQLRYTPEYFGATTTEDATAALTEWLESGLPLRLDKEYTFTTLDVTASNIDFEGSDSGLLRSTQSTFVSSVIKITGSNNKLKEGFNVLLNSDMRICDTIVHMVGNHNRVAHSDHSCATAYNPVNEGEQYRCTAVYLEGSNSSSVHNTSNNVGTGTKENGWHNLVAWNDYTNLCCGVSNRNGSRYAQVLGNTIDCNFVGRPLQGCAGIWGNRSHRFTVYSGNTIKRTGEHGAYLQGDGFTWDMSNFCEDTHKCALKIGAKPTGNFSYAGETLPTFNTLGEPVSSGGQYAVTGAKVYLRATGCNQTNGSDGTLCMQTNIADITVLGTDIKDCGDGSVNAIRSLFLSSEPAENQHVMANVVLSDGCKIKNSGGMSLACSTGLYVGVVDMGGENLALYAQDGTTNNNPIIKVINCGDIILTRATKPELLGVKAENVDPSNCTNAEILGGELTDQADNFDSAGRIVKLERVKITYSGTGSLNIDSVQEVESVVFNLPNSSTTFPLQYSFNSTNPTIGQFNNCVIKAPLSTRPFRIGGNVARANSNTIEGAAGTDYAMVIQGSGVTAIGNAHNAGSVRLDTASSGCFVVGPNISDAGTSNTTIST